MGRRWNEEKRIKEEKAGKKNLVEDEAKKRRNR